LTVEKDDPTEWILINYNEKRIIVGALDTLDPHFARACRWFGFTTFFWLKIPLEVVLSVLQLNGVQELKSAVGTGRMDTLLMVLGALALNSNLYFQGELP